ELDDLRVMPQRVVLRWRRLAGGDGGHLRCGLVGAASDGANDDERPTVARDPLRWARGLDGRGARLVRVAYNATRLRAECISNSTTRTRAVQHARSDGRPGAGDLRRGVGPRRGLPRRGRGPSSSAAGSGARLA